MLAGTASLLLVVATRRLATRTGSDRGLGIAALVGVGVVLAHSFVDYPLRTPALMVGTAALAGIAMAQAGQVRSAAGSVI